MDADIDSEQDYPLREATAKVFSVGVNRGFFPIARFSIEQRGYWSSHCTRYLYGLWIGF